LLGTSSAASYGGDVSHPLPRVLSCWRRSWPPTLCAMGQDPITLEVECVDERVRVTVSDGSADPPMPRVRNQQLDDGGFGLGIVTHYAAAWGWEPCSRGKRVWFEMATPGTI
jgi:hypothetical protein